MLTSPSKGSFLYVDVADGCRLKLTQSYLNGLNCRDACYMEMFSHMQCVASRLACLHFPPLLCTDDSLFSL